MIATSRGSTPASRAASIASAAIRSTSVEPPAPVGDVAAAAVAGLDQALVLEPGVDGADGVHVHLGPLGHRAHARHPLAGAEPAGGDQRPQPPGELHADRKVALGVGLEGGDRVADCAIEITQ